MKRIRPSSLKNIEICSDFEQPEDAEVHPLTEAGSRLHYAMETMNDEKLLEEDLPAFESGKQMLAEILPKEEPDTLLLEYGFRYPDGAYAGTVDRIQFHGDRAIMIDYKFGWNPVDHPSGNAQFQDYTVKAFDEWLHIDEIDVYMLAPRLKVIQMHTYKRSDVPRLKARIDMIHERQRTGGLRQATDNCRFCKHVGTCHEAYNTFSNPTNELPVLNHDWSIDTAEEVSAALKVLPVATAWFDSFKKSVNCKAIKLMEIGVEVEGFRLGTRKGASKVIDIDVVRDTLKDLGVSEEDFAAALTVSVNDCVKLARDVAPDRKKKVWETQFRADAAAGIEPGESKAAVYKQK